MDLKNTCMQRARAILEQNPIQNAYPLLRLANGMIAECEVAGEAVRLLDAQNGKYMYAVNSFESLRELYSRVSDRNGPHISLVTSSRFIDMIPSLGSRVKVNAFYQLLAATHLQEADMPDITFTGITAEAADWILSVYDHPELTREFIAQRAQAPTVLALHNDTPVGFIMSHCDAELGPAYVSPAYRASGLATEMFARVVRQFQAMGIRPAMFVSPENTRSLRWLERIGCIRADEQVLWFWRET